MPEDKKDTPRELQLFSNRNSLQEAYDNLLIAYESLKKSTLNTSGINNKFSFTSAYDHLNECILFLNDENKYIHANAAATNLTGYTASELMQLSEKDLIKRVVKPTGLPEGNHGAAQKNLAELIRKDGINIICHYKTVANIVSGIRLVVVAETNPAESATAVIQPEKQAATNILDSILDVFFCVDKNLFITYWNKAAEKFFMFNKAQALGKSLEEMDTKILSPVFFEAAKKTITENVAGLFETFCVPDKQWFEIAIYPSGDGLSIHFKDVTERKNTEEALLAQNERYDLAAKATSDCIWDWDFETNTVVRPGNLLEKLLGYESLKPEEVDGFWKTHVHPEDWVNIQRARRKIFDDSTINYWEDEYRFVKPDGTYSFINDRGYILRDTNGKAIRMIGASKDITGNKQQVNEILRIQQNLHSLINTTTDLVWSIDNEYRILAANKAFSDLLLKLTGKAIKEGDNILLAVPAEKQQGNWPDLYARALKGETFSFEQNFYNAADNYSWYASTTLCPILDNHGNISGAACYTKDITELKKAGISLEELNQSLEKRADELVKSNTDLEHFAYVASHDLQEPLRMISGFLMLLKKNYGGKLDAKADTYIHYSVDGAERMKQLINDLLQYSRVGTNEREIMKVNMNEVMDDILHTFQNEIKKTGAVIKVGKLPAVEAGKSAMDQLLQNLLGNALKYRRDENPIISFTANETATNWEFTMEDNGIGLDQKFGEKIFVIFQRLHQKDEYSGTGIGLAICRKIVERYQGKIWVESTLGIGSKFIFTIPKKTPAQNY